MTNETIDTGDHVRHEPSGETWVVAYVANELLCACGWPCTLVPLTECTLVKKAAPEGRLKLLHELAAMNAADPRKSYAARVLGQASIAPNTPDAVPDSVWEALQRMIEDGLAKGVASQEDARTVMRYRDRVRFLAALVAPPDPTGQKQRSDAWLAVSDAIKEHWAGTAAVGAEDAVRLIAMLAAEAKAYRAAGRPAAGAQQAVADERQHLRAQQSNAVMPQIGPLLDAWEGIDNDTKGVIREQAPGLAKHLAAIGRAMEEDALAAPAAAQGADCACCKGVGAVGDHNGERAVEISCDHCGGTGLEPAAESKVLGDDHKVRAEFESLANANSAFGLRRSRRGTYLNASIARDWKWFQLGALAATPAPEAAPSAKEGEAVQALVAEHARLIEQGNDYAYFELAYTRQTGWMAWITDKPLTGAPVVNPDRKVLFQGQGDSPEGACRAALNSSTKGKGHA